jgi:hypothetical protein
LCLMWGNYARTRGHDFDVCLADPGDCGKNDVCV